MADLDRSMFRVSWKAVAIGASLVALGCGVLLVIVSSIRDADTLSVVALALAVVAFVIQIMTYILQTNSSSRQERSVLEINADTLRALATIEEKSEGTRQSVDKISDKMLGVIIDKATTEVAVGSGAKQRGDVSDIVRRSLDLVTEQRSPKPVSSSPATSAPKDETMKSLPAAESLDEAVEVAKQLTMGDVVTIRWLGQDQETYGAASQTMLGVRQLPDAKRFFDLGLVKRVNVQWTKKPVFQLTDLGKNVARLLMVTEAEVAHIPELGEAREHVRADEELDARMASQKDYEDIPVEN